jgi:hypothetical protein
VNLGVPPQPTATGLRIGDRFPRFTLFAAAPPLGITCHRPPWARRASAAAQLALTRWVTPDLPLYGNDHDRGDFAP